MVDDVATGLIRALIENMKGARDDWASLAVIIDLRGRRSDAVQRAATMMRADSAGWS